MISVDTEFSDGSWRRGITGYFVRRSISFTFRDGETLGQIIREVLTSGANSISRVRYASSEVRKHKDTARLLALKAAKQKAELMSSELGNKVGRAVCVEEVSENPDRVSFYCARQFNQFNLMPVSDGGTATYSGGEAGGFALGTIPMTATVRATFF